MIVAGLVSSDNRVLYEMVVDDEECCEHCAIVSIAPGDKYCDACVEDIMEYLYRANSSI
jgi:hypothetical protein